jgi:hypothetical protein
MFNQQEIFLNFAQVQSLLDDTLVSGVYKSKFIEYLTTLNNHVIKDELEKTVSLNLGILKI